MNNDNYGPLSVLIGTWKGDRGTDVAPTPESSEHIPYLETMTFEAAGNVTNAGTQCLWIVRYHQVVQKKSDGEVFHDQIGYWTWDADQQEITQSLVIPRAVCCLAGGTAKMGKDGSVVFSVSSKAGDPHWGIVQTPFMDKNAKTTSFRHQLTVSGDTLQYNESTMLDIYGKEFDHTDSNTLIRIKSE
jgi:hypothetical protein